MSSTNQNKGDHSSSPTNSTDNPTLPSHPDNTDNPTNHPDTTDNPTSHPDTNLPTRSDQDDNNKNEISYDEKSIVQRSSEENFSGIASLITLRSEISEYVHRDAESSVSCYPGTERLNYDFEAERQNPFTTNMIESISHFVKGCLGAGVLTMHEAFMYGGIWFSLASTFLLGAIVQYSMSMLAKSAQKLYVRLRVSKLSYPDVAEAAVATGPLKKHRRFSKVFRYTVDICLFVELCGTCCIYEIVIASILKEALENLYTPLENLQLPIRVYLLITMIPLLAISLIRNLKYLAPASIIADIFVLICVITTMYYSLAQAGKLNERPAWKNVYGMFQFMGLCLYSISGINIVLPIENNMRRPRYIKSILNIGMLIVVTVVSLIGFFGYLAWGEECESPITTHLPNGTGPLLLLQFLLIAALVATFAVQFWVPFRIIWRYIGKRHTFRRRGLWERIFRSIHVLLITIVSITYPDVIQMMVWLGAVFLAVITFIFPAVIETLVTWNEHRSGKIRWRLLKNAIIFILGVVLCIGGFCIGVAAIIS